MSADVQKVFPWCGIIRNHLLTYRFPNCRNHNRTFSKKNVSQDESVSISLAVWFMRNSVSLSDLASAMVKRVMIAKNVIDMNAGSFVACQNHPS